MRHEALPTARTLREHLLRRPLLSAAGFFACGIACHRVVPFRPVVALGAGGLALVLWAVLRRRAATAGLLLAAATFLAGLVTAQLEAFAWPRDHIGHYTIDRPRPARLELRISTEPRILGDAVSNRAPAPRQVARAAVLRVLTTAGWKRASGTILLNIAQPIDGLGPGQRIEAFGMLHRLAPAMNEGQFDWARYYRDDRILAGLHVAQAAQVRALSPPRPSPLAYARRLVRAALRQGFDEGRAIDHALLRALVLGDSDPQLRDVQEQFLRTGTSHHLAISGMHIAVIGALVFGVCRLLLLGPRAAAWLGLATVIGYGLVALPSPPVVRSVLLCSAYALGMLWGRWLDGIQLLSLSVLAMLMYRPLDMYSAGFQLSFGTVLGLMVFTRPALRLLAPDHPHDAVAQRIAPPGAAAAAAGRLRKWLVGGVAAGVVAWLVSAPLIACHFDQLNPWATAASLALAIPVFLALVGGVLKIALTLLLPFAAGVIAPLAAAPVSWMRCGVELLGQVPGSDVVFPRPPLWLPAAYYALLALFLVPRPAAPHKAGPDPAAGPSHTVALLRFSPLCALALLLSWYVANLPGAATSETRLTVMAVGAGQCAVVRLASGAVVLVDAGSSSMSDPARACIVPALRRMGVRRIEAVFVSHADMDHLNALPEVLRQFDVAQVFVGEAFEQHSAGCPAAGELADAMRRRNIQPSPVARGRRIGLDDDAFIEVLWPPAGARLGANNSSLVLRLTAAGRSVLFPGDIEGAVQRVLAARPAELRADVLVAPHHGSPEPALSAFVEAVDPRLTIVSSDSPRPGRQEAFGKQLGGRRVLYTCASGAVTVGADATGTLRARSFLVPGRTMVLPR